MSGLGDVFASVQRMSQWQLLFGFLACIGYALAQGSVFGRRVRTVGFWLASLAVVGFVLEASEWVHAIMLVAVGVGALGLFAVAVWGISGLLRLDRTTVPATALDSAFPEAAVDPDPAPARALHPATPQAAASH